MVIYKIFLRIIFIWIPLVFLIGYLLFCGLVLPFFFGNGVEDFKVFVEKENAPLLVVQLLILFVVNFLYDKFWYAAEYMHQTIVKNFIGCIDTVYDKLLGGPYGRGSSGIAQLISVCVYFICACFGGFMLFYIMAYLIYEALGEMSLSWSAWMKWKYAERVTYRWLPLTVALLVFIDPLLHIIDRPVRGVFEKVMKCFKKSDSHISIQEEEDDE